MNRREKIKWYKDRGRDPLKQFRINWWFSSWKRMAIAIQTPFCVIVIGFPWKFKMYRDFYIWFGPIWINRRSFFV